MSVELTTDVGRLLVSVTPDNDRRHVEQMVVGTGALLENGHFQLKSGLHSAYFLQFAALAKEPANVESIAALLGDRLRDCGAQCVVVPSSAAAVLGYELALNLDTKLAFVSLDAQGYPAAFARNFEVPNGERVLLVTDIITTGHTVRLLDLICRKEGLVVVGAAAFASRGSQKIHQMDIKCKQRHLTVVAEFDLSSVDRVDCSQCRAGEPVTSFWDLDT